MLMENLSIKAYFNTGFINLLVRKSEDFPFPAQIAI